jgi:hypothetical protein
MLMRPTVLPTPEIAAKVANQEREHLSGVRQGEFELRRDERERNEKIDAEMAADAAKRLEKAKKEAKKHHGTNAPAGTGDTNADFDYHLSPVVEPTNSTATIGGTNAPATNAPSSTGETNDEIKYHFLPVKPAGGSTPGAPAPNPGAPPTR